MVEDGFAPNGRSSSDTVSSLLRLLLSYLLILFVVVTVSVVANVVVADGFAPNMS